MCLSFSASVCKQSSFITKRRYGTRRFQILGFGMDFSVPSPPLACAPNCPSRARIPGDDFPATYHWHVEFLPIGLKSTIRFVLLPS
jgi:hypothetical protein